MSLKAMQINMKFMKSYSNLYVACYWKSNTFFIDLILLSMSKSS